MELDGQLALIPLQQAMRVAGMRRELSVPHLAGGFQVQLGQQIGGGLQEFMHQFAMRLGAPGTQGGIPLFPRDWLSIWGGSTR